MKLTRKEKPHVAMVSTQVGEGRFMEEARRQAFMGGKRTHRAWGWVKKGIGTGRLGQHSNTPPVIGKLAPRRNAL